MAKDAKAAVANDAQAITPKKSKKLLIIIVAALLLLVSAAGAGVLLLKHGDEAADDDEVTEAPKAKKKESKGKELPPTFVNLEPFTVNLVPETGDQYLQVTLSVEFEEPTSEQLVKVHMPKIRNNVTLLLSAKKASDLLSREGKQKLAEELRDTINDVLSPPKKNKKGEVTRSDDGPAKEVLFTSFIIQ